MQPVCRSGKTTIFLLGSQPSYSKLFLNSSNVPYMLKNYEVFVTLLHSYPTLWPSLSMKTSRKKTSIKVKKVGGPSRNFTCKQRLIQTASYTDKKGNQIFIIYKEIQNGAVAKSYMTNGLLIHIWGNVCAFPHILGSPSSYRTLQLLHSKFPYK